MAWLEHINLTQTSLDMRIAGLDTSYSGTTRYYTYYVRPSGGSWQNAGGRELANNVSVSSWYGVSGLSPGTIYSTECRISNISGTPNGVIVTGSFRTESRQRPSNFYWSPSPYSGGAFNISASMWNAFTSRINEFCAYKGLSSYSYTYVRSGDPVYYYVVNEAANQIRQMNSSAPSTVSSGQIIYASFFLNLQNSLNGIS